MTDGKDVETASVNGIELASSNVDEDEKMKPFKYIVYEILYIVHHLVLTASLVHYQLQNEDHKVVSFL